MQLSVATNLHALARTCVPGLEVHVVPYVRPTSGVAERLKAFRECLACDYVLINCSPYDLFEFCAVKASLPFTKARIISLDTILPVPRLDDWRSHAGLWLKKRLFRQPHLFIEYFKDTSGYERHYGIPGDRFRYVPFKINRYERVLQTPTRDAGYIFCGGNTRRDFRTLIAAIRGLPFPVRIVTMDEHVIGQHGSSLDERELPPNVVVVRHDGSDSFVEHIADARFVVLPIVRENISASGIGVSLAAMALGKCVIASSGPAFTGVVPAGAAVIVPPEEPSALRAAMEKVWTDDAYRSAVAAAGREYALALGGEERLCRSVMELLVADRLAWETDRRQVPA